MKEEVAGVMGEENRVEKQRPSAKGTMKEKERERAREMEGPRALVHTYVALDSSTFNGSERERGESTESPEERTNAS